jgi:ribonucleoside-diphosphate reductase alpha chain
VPDENGYGQKTFGDLMPSDGVPVSGLSSPELSSRAPSDLSSRGEAEGSAFTGNRQLTTDNRVGHHHASDALQDLIDMGDSPSCPVCGAIMTRNGSCYRCMSCGSTSGCS